MFTTKALPASAERSTREFYFHQYHPKWEKPRYPRHLKSYVLNWDRGVRLRNSGNVGLRYTDERDVRRSMPEATAEEPMSIPWAMHMKAVSTQEPSRLVRSLTGAILGCGGWVLSRGATDSGTINLLFEFERQACLDIYSLLIAAGVELSATGHMRLTTLCQCTRTQGESCRGEIASVDLEIQTLPAYEKPTRQAPGPM